MVELPSVLATRERLRVEKFRSDIELGPGRATVVLHGEIDISAAPCIQDILAAVVADGWNVDVDLRGVSFLDSSGLHALLAAQHAANDKGLQLGIVGMAPCVERVLHLTGTYARLHAGRPLADRWSTFSDAAMPLGGGDQQLASP
jgi:anti-sigma B factor antagonist